MKQETYDRLPQAAKEHIKNLELKLSLARRALEEYTDLQTPSHFYSDSIDCSGDKVKNQKVYIQADHIGFSFGSLEVTLHKTEEGYLRIYYDGINYHDAFIRPGSRNSMDIIPIRREDVVENKEITPLPVDRVMCFSCHRMEKGCSYTDLRGRVSFEDPCKGYEGETVLTPVSKEGSVA